ncbi:hypothetical protein BDY19DRAFT_989251 [Irpex rosettiformis]|uniref:Uncharacterized protein n=1 Tax=Irpex rosettiformis TaxID=378272 RepID=A0ACB8UI11_9APHY|nr:hypothetical protein BDY19DRAFT_989251 [Irpex rosettiformis]
MAVKERSFAGFDTRTLRGRRRRCCPNFGSTRDAAESAAPAEYLSRVPPTRTSRPSSSSTTTSLVRGQTRPRAQHARLKMPLLSRVADPLLGVFTGVLAYRLYEINPRNGFAERDRLFELIKWKQEKVARQQEAESHEVLAQQETK